MKNFIVYALLLCSTTMSAKENISQNSKPATQQLNLSGCAEPVALVDLNINNVRARIFTGGDMWWNLVDGSGSAPEYEVPKGSGKCAMFAGSLWVGGYDGAGNLKVAAQTYRQTSKNDFFTGPLSLMAGNLDVSSTKCNTYDRFWNITKADVQTFVNTGISTPDIVNWPGNGDVAIGELPQLAPYEDVNGDGVYNTADGDYPRYNLSNVYPVDPNGGGLLCNDYVFGDQTLWWVFNDVGNVKTETTSLAIGLEIRAQAFEFVTNNGTNNCTFYRYQIINQSSLAFDSTYIGIWADPDLGDGVDDYVGCDVMKGLGYCYNADNDDGSGTLLGYGLNPPAIGINFLQGPLADVGDGIDNDKDGTTDEPGEQIIMSNFMKYDNLNNSPFGNPVAMDDYYQLLTSSWLNGVHASFDGSNGQTPPSGLFPACNYLFPGTTDPGFPTVNWTEATVGNNPDDRRFIMSAGDFNMLPGQINYITTSVMWARGSNNLQSVDAVKALDDTIQAWFATCFNPVLLGTNEIKSSSNVFCYPNPMTSISTIKINTSKGSMITLKIYDSKGVMVETETNNKNTFTIKKKNKPSGIYFYSLTDVTGMNYNGKLLIK